MTDFDDVSVFDLNRQRAAALQSAREQRVRARTNDHFRAKVGKRLGFVDGQGRPVQPRVAQDISGRALAFEVEPGLILPALELSVDRSPGGEGLTVTKVGVDWKSEQAASIQLVVPGVLAAYDLPDLAARLASLPLTIEKPVDAVGEPVSQPMLERSYGRCRQACGTTGPLVLRADTNSR